MNSSHIVFLLMPFGWRGQTSVRKQRSLPSNCQGRRRAGVRKWAALQRSWLRPYALTRRSGASMMMKAIGFMRVSSGVAVVSSLLLGSVPARASVLEQTKKIAGVTVDYKVVLPDGYDAT